MCVRVEGFEFHIGSHEVFTGGVYLSFINGSRGLLSLESVLEQKATLLIKSNKLVEREQFVITGNMYTCTSTHRMKMICLDFDSNKDNVNTGS